MITWATAKFALATAILAWAVVEDLRTRKFKNRSFLIALAAGFSLIVVHSVFTQSGSPFITGIAAASTALVFFFPLVQFKIVGAGDLKLMTAIGLCSEWNAILETSVIALLWAAIFGVIQIIARKDLKGLATNLLSLTLHKSADGLTLNRIPLTVPLLLGWLTQWTLARSGQGLW